MNGFIHSLVGLDWNDPRRNPEIMAPFSRVLQERMRPGGRPTPLGLRLLNVVLLVHWVIAGLDRGRLHWTDAVRGQHVVSSGPYAFVRHPGYGAGILIVLASGVALGSWLAAAFLAAVVLPFLIYRVRNEDRVLRSQLDGYADYARAVPWRLVPGLW